MYYAIITVLTLSHFLKKKKKKQKLFLINCTILIRTKSLFRNSRRIAGKKMRPKEARNRLKLKRVIPTKSFHPFNTIKSKGGDYLETIVPVAPCTLRGAL